MNTISLRLTSLLLTLLLIACAGDEEQDILSPAPTQPPAADRATVTPTATSLVTANMTVTPGSQDCSGTLPIADASNDLEVRLLRFAGSHTQISEAIGTGMVDPVLSPDGKRIAYFGLQPRFGLWVADVDGRNAKRLADVGQLHDHNPPVWSSRSDRLTFESARSTGEGAPADVFVVNADGSGLTNVTHGAVSAFGPTLSPEGSNVAFGVFESGGQVSNIYTARADGSELRRLTNNTPGRGSVSAAWSPDGSLIAYISNQDGYGDIHVMRPDGSNQTNLTRSPAGEFMSPVGHLPLEFSPDGKKIAFLSDREGNLDVFSINTDGSSLLRLTTNPGSEISPRWSADGRCLTFSSFSPSSSGGAIYLVRADGTGLVQLTKIR
jgi:Tol biopolymer transport system component